MLTAEWRKAIEGYLAHERAGGKRTSTSAARRQHLEHLARRVNVGPWQVTTDILLDFLAAQEWASETRRGRRTTFGRFYAWGMFRGFVHVNPVDDTPHVRTINGAARPAPDKVYHEALLAADPRAQLMLRLAAELGLRRGEVARVHTRDLMVDLVNYSLIVHGKGGRDRIVPLPQSLGQQLATEPAGYLFPGRDNGHLSPRYIGKIIRDLLPGEWTMHTLRHRFGTRAYALTSDLLLVQDLLGHASPSTTRRYVAGNPTRAREAIEALAAQTEQLPPARPTLSAVS
ncbi:site-specific integrase [Microbacterium sp. PAMC21962]|uniref:tyrosine-type recombinase/integrase n=1 Tax=Microbacterium sp. PAMC21962 TaxID=2861280 RepID=UPI001C637DB2|nr:site-specific integrase [Microbacterium sp. PAMC21962]QYF98923.1 site-specific integrase [Microbacterium sp. PAMC21962]